MVEEGMALTHQARWEVFHSTQWRDYGICKRGLWHLTSQCLLSCGCARMAPGTNFCKSRASGGNTWEKLISAEWCWSTHEHTDIEGCLVPAWRTMEARCWLEHLSIIGRGERTTRVQYCKDAVSAVWILRIIPELKLSSWDKRSAFWYEQHQQLPLVAPSKKDKSCLLPSDRCPFPILSSKEASNQRRRRSRGHPSLFLSPCRGPALMARLGLETAEGFGLNGRLKLRFWRNWT